MTTFKEWATAQLSKLKGMTRQEMIDHFPHKAQVNLFEMWKQEVINYEMQNRRLQKKNSK